MITVLFLETSLGVGGSETIWNQLIRNIDRKRFNPILCCLYSSKELGEKLNNQGFVVYDNLSKGRWDLSVYFKLNKILKINNVDILYVINQPLTQFWASICRKSSNVPILISSIHSMGMIDRRKRRIWVNKLTFSSVDCVTALSKTHKEYLSKKEGISPNKIEIIPNGIDIENYKRTPNPLIKEKLGIPATSPVVGIVAMLRPEKAHDIFIKAAKIVLGKTPKSHFLIIGDGSEREKLEGLTKTLGIDKKVHFLGVRHDIAQLIGVMDVAVLCSYPVVETLSISVLEYMASSKPVVATRVGSLSELVVDGVNGFLVNPGDTGSLATKIENLIKNKKLANQLGKNGLEKVVKCYTIERMVKGYELLFERYMSRKFN